MVISTAIRVNAASAFISLPQSPLESRSHAFQSSHHVQPTYLSKQQQRVRAMHVTEPATATRQDQEAKSQPRTGFAQVLLNMALNSPLWEYVLVPQARASIVKTAEENGIPWIAAREWLRSQKDAPWNNNHDSDYGNIQYPEYYTKSFHAYSEGNLNYDAAFEQELASRSIGARNFPKFGSGGEDVFRGAFDKALLELGARVIADINSNEADQTKDAVVVDFGCGTGTSTRRLAEQYPEANQLIGIDLSPYFIDVGNTLLKLAPSAITDNSNPLDGGDSTQPQGWITTIQSDPRIDLRQGDIANTQLPSNYASVVNLSLVLHELPTDAAKQVVLEAYRILQPGGQVWISEMDFESPAYKAQRENALLFSLLRATEPYLDEYADGMPELRNFIVGIFGSGGGSVKIAAATGRHYAIVAEKGIDAHIESNNGGGKGFAALEDYRFLEDGSYAVEDTHLKPWESKDDA